MTDEPDQPEEAEVVATAEPTTAALVPVPHATSALVEPAAKLDSISLAFSNYQTLCTTLLDDSDYQRIGDKEFRKKSGWRKLAVAFGVSCELLDRNYERFPDDGTIRRAEVVVRATAPNGRFMDGLGVCDIDERDFSKPEHDIPATAMTRATNRACADLFGMGEVSAEEAEHDQPPKADPYASPDQYRKLVDLVAALPAPERERTVTGEGEVMGVKVRDENRMIVATESQVDTLIAAVKGLLEATPDANDPDQAPFDNPVDTTAPHPGVVDVPGPDDLTTGKHGYDNWPSSDLELECQLRDLPKSGPNAKRIERLRAWDAINQPEGYVEPDERPF